MTKRLLYEKAFLFEAHNEKAFAKLRDNQFSRTFQGLIHEPFANALDAISVLDVNAPDQETDSVPIRVALRRGRTMSCLSFADTGQGLTAANLAALHYIGKTTKRETRETQIGRFGMGLVGAFNRRLGVRRVVITTTVCGQPARITLRCPEQGMPRWRMHCLSAPVTGFAISFLFPVRMHQAVEEELEDFFEDCLSPVEFNGELLRRRPEDVLGGEAALLIRGASDSPAVFIGAYQSPWRLLFNKEDLLRIYLRGMLVEKGSAYHAYQESGDKMPQNWHGRPYLDNESILVLADRGEPTVGRDKLLRDAAFEEITQAIHRTRAAALLEIYEKGRAQHATTKERRMALDSVQANLYTLRNLIADHLKGQAPDEDRAYLVPLMDALTDYPAFQAYGVGGETWLSVREILELDLPGGVICHARSRETFEDFRQAMVVPFVLRAEPVFADSQWGGHDHDPVQDSLRQIINAQPGRELFCLDDLHLDQAKKDELARKGVFSRRNIRIRRKSFLDEPEQAFLERLKELLNRPWFRRALARFDPPTRIRLQPIVAEMSGYEGTDLVATILKHNPRQRELDIGINMDSNPVKALIRSSTNAEPAFLPILCHELAHRSHDLEDGGEELISHTRSFHMNMLRLEDTVLQACIKHLSGQDDPLDTEEEQTHGAVLVL